MNQTLQLILFAILAGVVLYQLYSVLGRRVGRQPEDEAEAKAKAEAFERGEARPVASEPEPIPDGVVLTGLAALRARDPQFDIGHFLSGAKGAYQMVVKAFAEGDRETLKRLLSPAVYDSFEAAITAREAEGATETVEFAHPPRADLETATMDGDIAKVVVRFLAEFRARTKNAEGEAVDDRRTAELWTFERDVTTRDPNWTLVNVDAAEA